MLAKRFFSGETGGLATASNEGVRMKNRPRFCIVFLPFLFFSFGKGDSRRNVNQKQDLLRHLEVAVSLPTLQGQVVRELLHPPEPGDAASALPSECIKPK